MTKRAIKIVILFVLLITILLGGWHMYKRLEGNKRSFDTNIYEYVSPEALEVININRAFNLEKFYAYDCSFSPLTDALGQNVSYPLVLSKYNDGYRLLVTKVTYEQEQKIRSHIENNIALPFPPRIIKYEDCNIYIYTVANDKFLVCTYYKGLFAISDHYKIVENIIDTNPEDSFFAKEEDKEFIEKVRDSSPVSIYLKLYKEILALDYSIHNDTIKTEGYLLNRNNKDTIKDLKTIPYMIHSSDSICVESYEISTETKPATVKILLNKIY
ncbi:hypothetical protein [Prevotella sp. 10(H)]|uniref:hypothetical protein n=1 Tax=Prevotella sp. 10(H) TaxID=1158294 RepID=UPI0004A70F82|nr:hypothetical protein [Prevotella sp. 10(H)]